MKNVAVAAGIAVVLVFAAIGAAAADKWFKRRFYGVDAMEARLAAIEAACRSYGILPAEPKP